ncbi:MAG: biotin-dependent carboxyltransferase family protein [bacterium]|nr:biotin-dependent carboxyltransferase family protein [bacterium]MXV91238.1 biotin-dependent carboxyltransferase [Acidimicrobiia bacterium]MYC45312.1 biotin-dependent carboxyltransferase [Acidimicrobiia bacterium]MYI18959.1 biotin-dependent carboxyltransferase [Acidimicrobiia bacterium]
MALSVLKPGLATTVQDTGRPGYYNVGIPPSGSLDQYSSLAANLLVGNAEDAAVLECTYMGPELRFDRPATVAVTGADLPPRLGGEPRPVWESFAVEMGDVLSFDFLRSGARAYIAVSGGFDVPVMLGSRSTYALGALGGVGGRALAAGDELPIGDADGAAPGRSVPAALRSTHPKHREIRVMMGLYDHRLTDGGRRAFLDAEWRLTTLADRTGFRYRGAALEFRERVAPFGAGSDPSNIVDAPYPIGSIQIPGGVEPIVLHRDAVSGGGYVMVGTVISADMDDVGQSAPNITTRFVEVDLDGALRARRERADRLEALREAVR